ncbi:MAG: RodZ domain-containing protein [Syntrophales bacterium]
MTEEFQQDSSGHAGDSTTDLKSLRESHGLTLEDVSQATKISVKNLDALESANFPVLPPPIYVRAYIHAYAKMLAVDAGPLLNHYEKYLKASGPGHKSKAEETTGQKFLWPQKLLLQASGVAVAGVLIFFLFAYFNYRNAVVTIEPSVLRKVQVQSGATTPDVAVPAQPDVDTVAVVGQTNVSSPPQDGGLPEAARETPPAVLIITARQETWLRIREDGAAPYQLLMQPGERIARSASRYVLDIGNAGGLSLEFQGKIMKDLGKSGQVMHLQLPE